MRQCKELQDEQQWLELTVRYAAACLLHACLLDVMHDLMLWHSLWSKSLSSKRPVDFK
jgi:hypothetical protein